MNIKLTEEQLTKFYARVSTTDPSQCWFWTGAFSRKYPVFPIGKKSYRAHRLSYSHFVGPIGENLEIDHLCGNPGCVNFKHLEPVTGEENRRRYFESEKFKACYDKARNKVALVGTLSLTESRLETLQKLTLEHKSGCWFWKGTLDSRKGYPQYRGRNVSLLYHKLRNSFYNGEQIFLCKNPLCINPDHSFFSSRTRRKPLSMKRKNRDILSITLFLTKKIRKVLRHLPRRVDTYVFPGSEIDFSSL